MRYNSRAVGTDKMGDTFFGGTNSVPYRLCQLTDGQETCTRVLRPPWTVIRIKCLIMTKIGLGLGILIVLLESPIWCPRGWAFMEKMSELHQRSATDYETRVCMTVLHR